MENTNRRAPAPGGEHPAPRPRRRRRSKWQNFKEAYLPVIILVAAVILILTFVIGAIRRSSGDSRTEPVSSESTADPQVQLQLEQSELLAQAEAKAAEFDYQAAMDILNSYSAGLSSSTMLSDKYNAYADAQAALVPYNDISKIPNLAVQMLIADLPRALADPDYGTGFNRNYITTSEFSKILEQLYENGYMLVSPYDLVSGSDGPDGQPRIEQATVYLPAGKKPIILTQLGCNYFTYIVDGDGDGLPDKGGSGMPYRLALDEQGNLVSQMVDAAGKDLTGSFDFVTILNDFVAAHPDFSYRGARGVLAVTGYDGLFGYRTDPETAEKISQKFYDAQLAEVKPVIEKVRADGFDIACMSYDYINYASVSASDIGKDLQDWNNEVLPLLGGVDLMVMPYEDIVSGKDLYTGEKYEAMRSAGFRFFMAKGDAEPWGQITEHYARIRFLPVTGRDLNSSPEIYRNYFKAADVLDPQRTF